MYRNLPPPQYWRGNRHRGRCCLPEPDSTAYTYATATSAAVVQNVPARRRCVLLIANTHARISSRVAVDFPVFATTAAVARPPCLGRFVPNTVRNTRQQRRPPCSRLWSTTTDRRSGSSYSGSPSPGSRPCRTWCAMYSGKSRRDSSRTCCRLSIPTRRRSAKNTANGRVSAALRRARRWRLARLLNR